MTEHRVLLVKTSSLGDVVHLLPAITEAHTMRPDLAFDWLVETAYAPIASWHPAVDSVIPVALRRWRRRPWSVVAAGGFRRRLNGYDYQTIVDAQGLLKSALLARLAQGPITGPDAASAREPLAARLYARGIGLPSRLHAVERLRRLLAVALGYPLSPSSPAWGLDRQAVPRAPAAARDAIILAHGTTWPSKQWPEAAWRELAEALSEMGVPAALPFGSPAERRRAERIAQGLANCRVLPAAGLESLAAALAAARAVVGVDAGPLHLAAALNTPAVGLYGATDPALTGAWGANAVNLSVRFDCAPCRRPRCVHTARAGREAPPCFTTLGPARVLSVLHDVHGVLPPRAARWRAS